MHPVFDKRTPTGECFTLGNFVFMVREDQVVATTMQVNLRSQVMQRHHRAFNMPAWSSCPPGTRPMRFAWLSRFPQSKIKHVFFLFISLHTHSSSQLVETLVL